MNITIISLFPEMFQALNYGVISRGVKQKRLTIEIINPRQFTKDNHQTVDDRPFGGGPGMVLKFEPLRDAIVAAKQQLPKAPVILLTPQGKRLTQNEINKLGNHQELILIAGRYEGIDERIITRYVDEEWSIGDYVLSGGELAAMVMIDAIARLIPGVLGDEQSATQDSFVSSLLDCPHYTRPESIDGMTVPNVLLSGNHQAIASWRLKQALGRTWLRRPDLIEKRQLNEKEQQLLNEFITEEKEQ